MPRPARCPECGAPRPLRIIYGYPTDELLAAADRNEVALGGCLIFPNNPKWYCRTCDARWGDKEPGTDAGE